MKSILMVLFFIAIFLVPAQAKKRIDPQVGLAPYQVDDRYPNWRNGTPNIRTEPSVRKPRHLAKRAHRRVIRQTASPYRVSRELTHTARFIQDAGQAIVAPVQQTYRAIESAVVGSRPAGCPHRFCGCALSIKLFGRQVAGLNLAANWLRFPRTSPASGMVAARHGHVFQLLSHISGSHWKVWDANSGRGRIRIHARSIAGYQIVDPRRG